MDYRQARAFIEGTGKYGSVFGLLGIQSLMARLGNIQDALSIIHVAGTNGKGSICAMLASILQAAGYRSGVYASPAVFEPEEIMKVNGNPVSKEMFAGLATAVQAACMDMVKEGLPHPTAFEVETAIAFCFFQRENCDFVVLEAGLGGAGDATNLIKHPLCSVLASVSMDHMAVLGNTLQEIAAAKAGILKPGCPCVVSAQKPEVMDVVRKAAGEKGITVRVADASLIRSFSYDGQESRYVADWQEMAHDGQGMAHEMRGSRCTAGCPGMEHDGIESQRAAKNQGMDSLCGTLALVGAPQKENLACVLEVVRCLRERGICIPKQAVQKGLAKVRLPGRFERIAREPDFYIDGAHNEGAALRLRETVQGVLAGRRLVYIIGVFADKEYEKLLQAMLPYAAQAFTVTPDHPRALDGEQLARQAAKFHPAVSYVPDVAQAAVLAKAAAGKTGAVLAFGSFSYLGKLKRAVQDGIRQESRQKNG